MRSKTILTCIALLAFDFSCVSNVALAVEEKKCADKGASVTDASLYDANERTKGAVALAMRRLAEVITSKRARSFDGELNSYGKLSDQILTASRCETLVAPVVQTLVTPEQLGLFAAECRTKNRTSNPAGSSADSIYYEAGYSVALRKLARVRGMSSHLVVNQLKAVFECDEVSALFFDEQIELMRRLRTSKGLSFSP
ncbi:MAG: hypothetical protein K2Y32_11245 [Candidatus Obscuribacterales bacterium]|nr:hypothetical protein [Candidatus Obscuribacterales bacterium]